MYAIQRVLGRSVGNIIFAHFIVTETERKKAWKRGMVCVVMTGGFRELMAGLAKRFSFFKGYFGV